MTYVHPLLHLQISLILFLHCNFSYMILAKNNLSAWQWERTACQRHSSHLKTAEAHPEALWGERAQPALSVRMSDHEGHHRHSAFPGQCATPARPHWPRQGTARSDTEKARELASCTRHLRWSQGPPHAQWQTPSPGMVTGADDTAGQRPTVSLPI